MIHIVDDDVSFRTVAKERLQSAGYEVQIYSSAEQFLDQERSGSLLGCLLVAIDIRGANGLDLQARMNEAGSVLPILFVSDNEDTKTIVRAVKAGAEDFLIKPVTCDVLLAAVGRAIARHETARKLQSELSKLSALIARLTPREREVYDLVIRGKTNKQISLEIGASIRTIKAHRHVVMAKMQAQSLVELTMIADRLDRRNLGI